MAGLAVSTNELMMINGARAVLGSRDHLQLIRQVGVCV